MQIDIIRTSASRPELLKISTESIIKNLIFSGKINWYIHEDVLHEARSKECIQYCKSLNLYNKILVDGPPALGHTNSFYKLIDCISSEYFMYWEDDYELLNVFYCPVCKSTTNKYKASKIEHLSNCKKCNATLIEFDTDLDVLLSLMDKYKNINEICFPKRDIMPDKPGFVKQERQFDGTKLTVCNHWYVSPAIWRTSFIMPILQSMKNSYRSPEIGGYGWHWEINRRLKGQHVQRDADWIYANIGTYYLGAIRTGQRIYHVGTGDNSLHTGEMQKKW